MVRYHIDNKFNGSTFWSKYYNAVLPHTLSSPYTIDGITYKKDTTEKKFLIDKELSNNSNNSNTKQCKSGFKSFNWDKPMIRKYFYSDDIVVNSGGNNKCLVNKNNIHDLIEAGVSDDDDDNDNVPKYSTEKVVQKKKKKFSENKYSINWKFPEKKKYVEKYSRHYPLPMATSIYIPEIKVRFELNSETRWYEPTLLYNIED